MDNNIFEIIVQNPLAPESGLFSIFEELSLTNSNFFLYDDYSNQKVPRFWYVEGYSPIPDFVANALLDIFANGFDEGFNNDSDSLYSSAHHSFYEPIGWTVYNASVANSGLNAAGNQLSEDDTTNGYSYYNGNNGAIIPSLNLMSHLGGSGNTHAERIGTTDNLSGIPAAVNNISGGGDVTLLPYTQAPTLMYEFGSYRTTNQSSTVENISSVVNVTAGDLIRLKSQDAVLLALSMAYFYNQGHFYLWEGYNQDFFVNNKIPEIPQSLNHANHNRVGQPLALTLENIFSTSDIGKRVSFVIGFNGSTPTDTGTILDNTWSLSGGHTNSMTSNAISLTNEPAVNSHTFWNPYPYIGFGNALQSSTQTNTALIQLNGNNQEGLYTTQAETRLNLRAGSEFNLGVYIIQSTCTFSVRVTNEELEYNELVTTNSGLSSLTGARHGFFTTPLQETLTPFKIIIKIQGSDFNSDILQLGYIKLRAVAGLYSDTTPIINFNGNRSIFNSTSLTPYLGEGAVRSNKDVIITSTDFSNDTFISKYHYYNGSQIVSDEIESTSDTLQEPVLSKQQTINFFDTNGNPKFNEEESFRVNPKNDFAVDAELNQTEAVNLISGSFIIGSTDMHIFADSITGATLLNSTLQVSSIEFKTAENAYISQGTSGGNEIQFYYNATSAGIEPPYIVLNQEITDTSTPITIQINLASYSGDSLFLDSGDGTEASEIDSAGLTSHTITLTGGKLRIRLATVQENSNQALGTTAAVITYVVLNIGANIGTVVGLEKYGDETTINTGLLVSPYEAAFRVRSYDHLTGNPAAASPVITLEKEHVINSSLFDFLLFSNISDAGLSYIFKVIIDVKKINTGNTIEVIENYSSTANRVTTVNSTGITTIDCEDKIWGIADNIQALTLKIKGNSSIVDTIINSVKITCRISTPTTTSIFTSLDLNEDFNTSLNFSVKDFNEVSKSSGSYSKTIRVPATSNNKKALLFTNEINAIKSFVDSSGFPCLVKSKGLVIFQGKLHLTESSLGVNGFDELVFNLKTGNSSWANPISNKNLRDIESGTYLVSSNNIIDSQEFTSLDDEIVFPLVDNGLWDLMQDTNGNAENEASVGFDNVKAAFRIKNLLVKIFESEGYTLDSNFFNNQDEWSSDFSTEFTDLTSKLVAIAPEMRIHEDDILNSKFEATTELGTLSSYTILDSGEGTNTALSFRCYLKSSILSALGIYAYVVDWCPIKLSNILSDVGGTHSYSSNVGTINGLYHPDNQDNLYNASSTFGSRPFASEVHGYSTSTGQPLLDYSPQRSRIVVKKSGYYEISTQSKVSFEWRSPGDFSTTHYLHKPSEFIYTTMLMPAQYADDSIYGANNDKFGAELFDLEDDASILIEKSIMNDVTDAENTAVEQFRLNNTRIELNRIQYLKAGEEYIVMTSTGSKTNATNNQITTKKTLGSVTYTVHEFDISMKLSKSISPLKGKSMAVYNSEATPKVSYREVLPDATCLEFISDVTKMFNLIWSFNPYSNVVTAEPYSSFFDLDSETTEALDWTEKSTITSIKQNNVSNSNIILKMNEDGEGASSYTVGGTTVGIGDFHAQINPNNLSEPTVIGLNIFSFLEMDFDKFIVRNFSHWNKITNTSIRLPKVWGNSSSTLTPDILEQKPEANNSHGYKLAYEGGLVELEPNHFIRYVLEKRFLNVSGDLQAYSGIFLGDDNNARVYREYASFSDTSSGYPNLSFSSAINGSSLTELYHSKLINNLKKADKLVTAKVHLTPFDIFNLDFRRLVYINNNKYIISKVKDYNFSGEATEVELLLITE